MKKVKFRAWHKGEKKMLNPDYISCDGGCYDEAYADYSIYLELDSDYELMQYTGLKDKNDKEIYENDLFYYHNVLRQVVYREDNTSFMAIVIKGNCGSCNIYLRDATDRYTNKLNATVVGNIYENEIY